MSFNVHPALGTVVTRPKMKKIRFYFVFKKCIFMDFSRIFHCYLILNFEKHSLDQSEYLACYNWKFRWSISKKYYLTSNYLRDFNYAHLYFSFPFISSSLVLYCISVSLLYCVGEYTTLPFNHSLSFISVTCILHEFSF